MEKHTEIKGHARFENGRLITPKQNKPYNQNIRIVKRVRKSTPILSKEESKTLLKDIINALCEATDAPEDLRKSIINVRHALQASTLQSEYSVCASVKIYFLLLFNFK